MPASPEWVIHENIYRDIHENIYRHGRKYCPVEE
jgi:hypothetical protein